MNEKNEKQGLLALIPTPIGNREDITLRALRLLKEADLIACEDTRHTGALLDYYGIHAPLISNFEHNERTREGQLLDAVREGKRVCLVSDAGMPGISDPGAAVYQRCLEEGLPCTVLPGPSAGLTAYVASGLGDGTFLFLGFLPRKGAGREKILSRLDHLPWTAVLYESPKRIKKTLEELGDRWPERDFVLCREWTKTFEERIALKGKEAAKAPIVEKGEFVLLVGPAAESEAEEKWSLEKIKTLAEELESQGKSTKQIARELFLATGRSRNSLYQWLIHGKKGSLEKADQEEKE